VKRKQECETTCDTAGSQSGNEDGIHEDANRKKERITPGQSRYKDSGGEEQREARCRPAAQEGDVHA